MRFHQLRTNKREHGYLHVIPANGTKRQFLRTRLLPVRLVRVTVELMDQERLHPYGIDLNGGKNRQHWEKIRQNHEKIRQHCEKIR